MLILKGKQQEKTPIIWKIIKSVNKTIKIQNKKNNSIYGLLIKHSFK